MNIRSKLSSIREYLTPINNESNFRKTGEISPDEFVKAGDYLSYKFPTWSWGSAPKHLAKKFLPHDKQYLVTRLVPSYRRYSEFLPEMAEADADGSTSETDPDTEWVPRFATSSAADRPVEAPEADLDDLIDENAEDDGLDDDIDDFTTIDPAHSALRKYDLYICYSTSYRVPKMYLVGFNANGIPLLPHEMYEDIAGDYKDKTATIENLPMASNTTAVSIHPCKHSSVMRVFMQHAARKSSPTDMMSKLKIDGAEGDTAGSGATSEADSDFDDLADEGIRVDQYLVIFLKFIASVTPGIEYDFTMDAL